MQLKEVDKKFLARAADPENIEIIRSKDSFLFDANGKKYIDFIMGWCVGSMGWGNDSIRNSVKTFDGPEYVYGAFLYKPWVELASLLAEISPGKNLVKSFRTTGGSGSIDTAMKIALLYTGRSQFLSVEGAYHGNSFGAISIGARANIKIYKNLLPGCRKIDAPLDAKAARKVESILKKKTIAAFVIEPISTHPQIRMPDENFMDIIQGLCKKYGTLLVADEVAVGFGRTGKIFASEHFCLEPDVLCLAKAISGGNAAIGTAMTSEKIAKAVQKKIHAYPTYGWHPLSVQAALASTTYLVNNRDVILRNVQEMNDLFCERLLNMKFKKTIRLASKGMAFSIDVGSSSYASRIFKQCLVNGLLIETNGKDLMLFPALTLDKETAGRGLKILQESI